MSCVVIAPKGNVEEFSLPESIVRDVHNNIFKVAGNMTRLIVVAPRLLEDTAFELANKVPTIFVITNFTDILHLQMHLRSGVLYLTAFDGIAIADSGLSGQISAPWVQHLGVPLNTLADWSQQQEPELLHSVPSGFEELPKMAFTSLAAKMREVSFAQYDVTMTSSASCAGMFGVITDLSNLIFADLDKASPDIICAEMDDFEDLFKTNPSASLLVCPVVLAGRDKVETLHFKAVSATQRPMHLLRAVFGWKSTSGLTPACFIYGLG